MDVDTAIDIDTDTDTDTDKDTDTDTDSDTCLEYYPCLYVFYYSQTAEMRFR